MDERLLEWLCSNDTGTSSKAIALVMSGMSPKIILKENWSPYPHDSDDFGRCYRLLEIFPEWRKRIKEMGCLGKIWKMIASAWDELEPLYKQNKHKMLYQRLQQLQPDELEENCDKVSMGNGISISFPSQNK